MDNSRRQFSSEFKQAAVAQVVTGGRPLAQVARSLGIRSNMLHRWKQEAAQHGEKAFPGNGVPIEEELARLRLENEMLREERDILKKATVFFARHSTEK